MQPHHKNGFAFFPKLSVGEWVQYQFQCAIRRDYPEIAITGFGNVPTSQRVHEIWGWEGTHSDHAKPLIFVGAERMIAPDAMMVREGNHYAVEIKQKRIDPRFNNILLDVKEIIELETAAAALNQQPLFIFHTSYTDEIHPEEHIGDHSHILPLESFYTATPEYLRGLSVWPAYRNSPAHVRAELKDLVPAVDWMKNHAAH
jgi:hypothetical protein